MTILVTGDCGMIGSRLVSGLLEAGYTVVGVDRAGDNSREANRVHIVADLSDKERMAAIAADEHVDRVIHLAALAHTKGEDDLSWQRYYHVNVECAQNVFAAAGDRPVLFISTVDVYGFYDGKAPVSGSTEVHPVSNYGKSKAMAEEACRKLPHWDIFRFSPVYTAEVRRDIQKRYYLKYPDLAYRVGKGTGFEVLAVERAVAAMVAWCGREPAGTVTVLKDEKLLWTPDAIREEKAAGRAKHVLWLPRWMVSCGYGVLKTLLGKNDKTYLLNKAVHPLRSE